MSLIVEDGSVVANADSYVSVLDADTYHSRMGNSGWVGSDAVKTAALLKATQFIDLVYLERWKGYRVDDNQNLQWPRTDVWVNTSDSNPIPQDSVPTNIVKATCEAALKYLTSDLLADLERGGHVKAETIGEFKTEFFNRATSGTTYRILDTLLKPFLEPKVVKVVRT